jgi:hypothetical protein
MLLPAHSFRGIITAQPHSILLGLKGLNSVQCTEAELVNVIGTKVLKSFPPCYSLSPLLTDFIPLSPSKCGLKLDCNVNIVLFTETSSLRILKIIPRNLIKLNVHEFGFCTVYTDIKTVGIFLQQGNLE